MSATPLLILSDAPSSTSGLGRITRDIATRAHANLSEFRVGCLGYGGPGRRDWGFPEYHLHSIEGWQVPELKDVWEDFAGGERGVLLTIWDPSRLRWLAQPDATDAITHAVLCPANLRAWLKARPFELWGYIPVDAVGPNGRLTAQIAHTLMGYDRLLAYSAWAGGIISETIGKAPTPSLPHGIDTSVFMPHDRKEAKARFRAMGFSGLTDDAFLVGIVATNQVRKDFGLGIETCARLLQQGLNVRLWIHTDTMRRHWDILALLEDFGLLGGRCVVTTDRWPDEQMSWLYSACDCTLGIGLGEGFGFPIFESLASGTPCVHGDYGGAAEWLPSHMLVKPHAWRLEGQFNCVRPVFSPIDWFVCINQKQMQESATLPAQLDWVNLWPRWAKWLHAGLKADQL